MNGRFQIAIHILTLLCEADASMLSSDYIAGSVNVNPVIIRKEISNLVKHGLVSSKEGKTGGYLLAKPAAEIYLADVYKAVQQAEILGRAKNKPNIKCPIGKQINEHLDNLEAEVHQHMLKTLKNITLHGFYKQFE